MANNASIRSTASVAIGALFNRAGSKNLRRACAQHRCLDIGPWLAVGFVEPVEARIGDRATSETTVPGCVAAATIRCFSALGHRRRRCTDVGTSTCVLESVVDCRSCRHNRPQGAYDASLSSALWSRVQVDLSPPALGRGPSSLCRRRRAASHDLRCVGRSAGPGSVPAAGKVPAEAGKARCGFPGGLSTGASTKRPGQISAAQKRRHAAWRAAVLAMGAGCFASPLASSRSGPASPSSTAVGPRAGAEVRRPPRPGRPPRLLASPRCLTEPRASTGTQLR
jgi:hypothetical protein